MADSQTTDNSSDTATTTTTVTPEVTTTTTVAETTTTTTEAPAPMETDVVQGGGVSDETTEEAGVDAETSDQRLEAARQDALVNHAAHVAEQPEA